MLARKLMQVTRERCSELRESYCKCRGLGIHEEVDKDREITSVEMI